MRIIHLIHPASSRSIKVVNKICAYDRRRPSIFAAFLYNSEPMALPGFPTGSPQFLSQTKREINNIILCGKAEWRIAIANLRKVRTKNGSAWFRLGFCVVCWLGASMVVEEEQRLGIEPDDGGGGVGPEQARAASQTNGRLIFCAWLVRLYGNRNWMVVVSVTFGSANYEAFVARAGIYRWELL